MTFEIFYAGEVSSQQIFYSDPKNYISPLGKYDKFIQKMDALAKEWKQLQEDAGPKIKQGWGIRDEEDIESKQQEMVALVQKEFSQQALDECYESGEENYFIHDSAGRLEVNDEEIENYKDFFGDEYEKWEKELSERLDKLDWYLIYDVLDSGVHTTGEGLEIEGEFDKKKLTMKDNCFHYDDEPIIDPDGTEREGAVLELYVGGECVSEVDPVWAEDEEEEEEEKEEKEDLNKKKFKYATLKGDSLFFDKGDAAEVQIYESLKDLSNGYFRGGECEGVGSEDFTPEFGECKDITEIEEFLQKCAAEEGLSEVFFNVEWQRNSEWSIDPDTLELGVFIEGSPSDNSYFHWKAGKLEEIYSDDLLEVEE